MAQYDANKKYSWKQEDVFTLTGQEFGLFLNIVRGYLATEEALKFQGMVQANQVIENLLKKSGNDGIVTEVVEPTQELSVVKE